MQINVLRVDNPYIDVAVDVFKVLSDPTRVRILLMLSRGELSVNEIAEMVDRPGPAVSQHLAKLRWARMVRVRHAGNKSFYQLVDEHAVRLVTEALHQAEHTVEDNPPHHRTTL